MLSEYTVPWVASENEDAWEIALEWIESTDERIASAGWATLSNIVSLKDDAELDIAKLKSLLSRVEKNIHTAQNRVRYTMNGFVISVAAYVRELTDEAIDASENATERLRSIWAEQLAKFRLCPNMLRKFVLAARCLRKKKTVKC